MKTTIFLSISMLFILSGCSSVYKAGQTPDDVYYSPNPEGFIIAQREEENNRYQEYINSADDRYLRMKVANRNRWSSLDDFDYWNDSRYSFYRMDPYFSWTPSWNNSLGYGNWRWYPYYGTGGWGNPICTVIGYTNPKLFSGYTSGSNVTAYKNKYYENTNAGYMNLKTGQWTNLNSATNNNGLGSLLKRMFAPSNGNSNSNTWDRPARTFSNNNNSGTSATSSKAGGNSGGVKSTGSSATSGRGGKKN